MLFLPHLRLLDIVSKVNHYFLRKHISFDSLRYNLYYFRNKLHSSGKCFTVLPVSLLFLLLLLIYTSRIFFFWKPLILESVKADDASCKSIYQVCLLTSPLTIDSSLSNIFMLRTNITNLCNSLFFIIFCIISTLFCSWLKRETSLVRYLVLKK